MSKNKKSQQPSEQLSSESVLTETERDILTISKMMEYAVLIPQDQFQKHFTIDKKEGLLYTVESLLKKVQEL